MFGGYQDVFASPDGTKFIAVGWWSGWASSICVSTNSGATWNLTQQDDSGYQANWWVKVAASADGRKIIVVSSRDVWTSTNWGVTWATNALKNLSYVRCSADGNQVLAASWDSLIYCSTNGGASWSPGTNLFQNNLARLACSADGSTFIAASRPRPAYVSTNRGATWSLLDAPITNWQSVACSADGCKIIASQYDYDGGTIYTAQSSPAPILNIAPSNTGTGVHLSWIVPSIPLMLQQNPDLTSTNWTAVLAEPSLNYNRLENEVCVPAPPGRNFYRLISK